MMKRDLRYYFLFGVLAIVPLVFSQCGNQDKNQKIKLDSAVMRQTEKPSGLVTTLQVQPEEIRSIAVFHFENVIGDAELDWMRRGLPQMLITDLSQSRYVDIVTEQDLAPIKEKLGIDEGGIVDASTAVSIAKEARVETALVGSYIRIGNTIRIDCRLYDVQTGKLLKADRVEGEGLEQVFTLVDDLTRQVRDGLKLTLKGVVEFDRGLADVSTNSIEAYRFFAEGLAEFEKLFYQRAANNFERAVAIDTTFATAYLHLARAYINLARADEARQVMTRAVVFSDHVTERERLNIMALNANLKGDYVERLGIYEKMAKLFPNDKETHYNLANIYDDLGRFDEAINHYEAALEIDAGYKLVYNQLGYLYSAIGMHEKAVESLKQYIELAPDEPNPHDSIGEIYQRAGRLDEAIDEYKEAIRLGADLHYPWIHMGLAYQEKGEFGEAQRCFQRYIELAPSEAIRSGGYELIGETYWANDDDEEALAAYVEALRVYPDDFGVISEIRELYMDRGDTIEAQRFLDEWFQNTGERLLREDSFTDLVHFVATCVYNDLYIDRLEPYIEKAWQLSENDRNRATCTSLRALIDAKQGNIDSAMARWESNLALPSIENKLGISFYDAKIGSQVLAQRSDEPEVVIALFEKFLKKAKELGNPSFEASAQYFLLEFYQKIGDEDALERALVSTGTPRESDWWIIGPFENKGGFHRQFLPERETNLTKLHNGKNGKVHWRQAQDGLFDGYIDLKEIYDPDTWVVAYGLLSFDSPIVRQAQLRIGTDDGVRVWLNDEEVWTRNMRRGAKADGDIISVALQEGTNTVLIKVCQTISEWGFFFRITDPEGHSFGDITFLPQISS
ncbi:MAG: tetratricopeptide repeat protein [Gemmatimonadota bacterium]|nr:MAG: tetratricopeptide repeat protein [Gemmatimonadota bacterium]